MIKLLFNIAILLAIFWLVREMMRPKNKVEGQKTGFVKSGPEAEVLVEDPQCGVYIPKSHALKGPGDHWFCSAECLEAYRRSKG